MTEKCLEIVDAVASTDVLLNPPRREEGIVLFKPSFFKVGFFFFINFKDKFAGFDAKARWYLKQETLILECFHTNTSLHCRAATELG